MNGVAGPSGSEIPFPDSGVVFVTMSVVFKKQHLNIVTLLGFMLFTIDVLKVCAQ